MNPSLANMIKSNTPPIDPRVGLGLSYSESTKIPYFIDELIRVSEEGPIPKGLKYLGFRTLTPSECYRETTSQTKKSNSNKRLYNVNANDVRYYSYDFDYRGKRLSITVLLPFIRRHGFMYLNGVKYVVTPILADGIFTIKSDKIFFKTIKTRIWFLQDKNNHMVVDGKFEPSSFVYSFIHNKSSEVKHMKPTLVSYLCCKYGLTQTMRMLGFANSDWRAISRDEFLSDTDKYPKDKWVVIEQNGKKPTAPAFRNQNYYEASNMLFLVKRSVWEEHPIARSVFSALVYVITFYPSEKRMSPDLIDDIRAWRSILGETISGPDALASVIMESIDRHMESLDTYVNRLALSDLKQINLGHLDDFYKVLVYIVENFNKLTSSVSHYSVSNSMFGKQLQVLNFLLSNITNQLNLSFFRLGTLRSDEEKNPDVETQASAIEKAFKIVKPKIFLDRRKHSEFTIVDDPCDLPLLKMGRILVQQEKSDKERTSKTSFNAADVSNKLHESLMQVGAALDMTKSDPSGRSRLNPWVHLDDDLVITRNPELQDKMEKISDLLL